MPEITQQEQTAEGAKGLVLLAYGFRPMFILLPAYLALSMLLWGALWSGLIGLPFLENPLLWHIYELTFGAASAGIIGFVLTAVPEFYERVKPVSGKCLLAITLLWLAGRLSFWLIDWLGVWLVALVNLPLLLWLIALVSQPLLQDPQRRHLSLLLTLVIIWLIQVWFFVAAAGWVAADPMALLRLGLGAFMVLVLISLRRINTGAINEWLDYEGIDAVFIARPPRYNIAVLCITLFSLAEFLHPGTAVLGWLSLAAAAAILNTLNDFFLEEANILLRPYVSYLLLVLLLMAAGYGLMGWDYLNESIYSINHFRHFLTAGVLGLSFLTVMVIVGTIHTGRHLIRNPWADIAVLLVVTAAIARGLIALFPAHAPLLYAVSSLLWALAFVLYLIRFYVPLSQPRVDGLLG
mgnify:CR=1 FL=1